MPSLLHFLLKLKYRIPPMLVHVPSPFWPQKMLGKMSGSKEWAYLSGMDACRCPCICRRPCFCRPPCFCRRPCSNGHLCCRVLGVACYPAFVGVSAFAGVLSVACYSAFAGVSALLASLLLLATQLLLGFPLLLASLLLLASFLLLASLL